MTRYILLPALALIGVNIAAANDTTPPAQLESINGILVIPSAAGKDGKPLTTLQREIDAAGKMSMSDDVTAAPLPSTYTPLNRAEAQQQQALKEVLDYNAANPVLDAFKVTLGGYFRDILRLASKEEVTDVVDPTYDVSKGRLEFRSKYPIAYWDEYEQTVNESQRSALIARMEADLERDAIKARSPLGSTLGSLLDPILVFAILGVWLFFVNARKLSARHG